jgi:hypothetical protein
MEGDRSLSLSDTEVYSKNTFTSNDISGYDKLPFWIASDQKGYQSSLLLDGSTDYSNYIPDANTVGYWKMDEESGTGAYIEDFSSNSNDGTPSGTSFVENGRLGGAREFDSGSYEYVTIPSNSTIDIKRTISISLWFKVDSWTGDWTNLINKMDDTGTTSSRSYSVFLNSGGYIHLCSADSSGQETINTPTGSILLDQWYYYTAVIDRNNGVMQSYLNGKLKASGSVRTTDTVTHTHPLTIGLRSSYDEFNGFIDDVHISNIARTSEEIYESYNIGKRMLQPEIKFKADLQSSNLITDSSDKSFDISETAYDTTEDIENLESGDKIIITEDTYKAQGTVNTANTSTGAVTVNSWDSGSTFPSGGYTTSAKVFKWQKEYLYTSQVDQEYLTSLDQITMITSGQANIWYDDVRAGEEFAYIEDAQYLQYQPIFTKWDDNPLLDLYLTEVDITYTAGPTMDQVMRHGKWFNSSGEKQPFWWVGEN